MIFVNPYGPSLVLFPLALMGRSEVLSDVAEWQSVDFHSAHRRALRRVGRPHARRVRPVAAAAGRAARQRSCSCLLGWWAVRNVAIAVAVTLPDPRPVRSGATEPTPGRAMPRRRRRSSCVVLPRRRAARRPRRSRCPTSTLKRVSRSRRCRRSTGTTCLGGRLLTTDAWAGYVIYRYWPEQHVFFDDRYDMYPVKMTDAYNKILSLKPGWEKVLDHYRINVVVWPKDGAFVQALAHLPGWEMVRSDKVSKTFVREQRI